MKVYICLLWLFCARGCLSQDWIEFEKYETNIENIFTDDQTAQLDDPLIRHLRSVASEADDLRRTDITETEVALDEDGNPRDKRAFGFIIRGLASALGYTISPLQVASIPNPSPPPPPSQSPPPAPPKTPAAPKNPAPPTSPPAKSSTPKPQPNQRETLRITGLVNFGANANADLAGQLGRYEQLFHGNSASAPPAAPPPTPAKPPTPGPILKMTLPKIPNPIVPNLSPLLPPSRPPVSIPGSPPTKSSKQEVETEYRKTENFDKLNVQNKEINGDGNIYANAYQQEPDWRQGYFERLKELEERQKEYADKLAKHEALLAKQQQDHEQTDERFANREREIAERDKAHTARLEEREKESEKNDNAEDSRAGYQNADKSYGDYGRPQQSENEEEHADKQQIEKEEEKAPQQYSDDEEEPTKYQDYEDYPQKYSSYYSGDDLTLPISKDKGFEKSENLRNSYGESLEDEEETGGNIAGYFAKFKDPNTGLYMPEKTQDPENYNKEKEPWSKENEEGYDARLELLKQQYSSPDRESKYEEYELEDTPQENENPESAEKSKSNDEEDDESPQPKKVQKIPDYSEAFGGNEPHVKNSKQEHDREMVPPSKDTAESPGSESGENLNEESEKESEKSEDENDVPFYHFDFKGFAPYYSPIKYVYNSDETEPGISRINSYNKNAEIFDSEEQTKEDLPVEREEPKEEHQKIGLPEKLTIKNLHDGESKELRAWPAPFDYVFDSTEQTNVIELPNIQAKPENEDADEGRADVPYNSEGLQATPVEHLIPEFDDVFQNQREIQQPQGESESYHGFVGETKNLHESPKYYGFEGYSRPSSPLADTLRQYDVPNIPKEKYNSQESNTRINQDEISDLLSHNIKNHRYSSTETPSVNHRRNYETNKSPEDGSSQNVQASSVPHTGERNNHESPQQYHPRSRSHERINNDGAPISQNGPHRQFGPGNADLRNRGYDFGQQYAPVEPRLTGRRFDENVSHTQDPSHYPQPEDKSSLKFEDPKSAHDFFGFSQNDYDYENNKKIDKSQDIINTPGITDHDEASDLPVISDPTPYEYDEKLTEFTDGPESDTEKVKVKEYRNKQATVTISETKQLSPEGPVHLIGYKHNY